jgi:NAD+ diphosphatase
MKMFFATPPHFIDCIEMAPSSDEFWFLFQNGKLLVDENSLQPLQEKTLPIMSSVPIGKFKERHFLAKEALPQAKLPAGAVWSDLRALLGVLDDDLLALAGRAAQLIAWEGNHRFCGRCGTKTVQKAKERAKECPSCGLLAYPKISPVIMVLVQRGDEILLARGPNFPQPFYSALAGFVDPGETLEQCIEREVLEEVGLQVSEIRYFASQPWPFPHSLMIAFTCRWQSGEIKMDPAEIADAQWFKMGNLPLLPPPFSIARILIDAFTKDCK